MTFEILFTIFAAVVCLSACLSALDLALGIKKMIRLSGVAPFNKTDPPKVSLIVPACNEEQNIEQAMRTLLHQTYENYEVIAVNDRSIDRTGEILDVMNADQSRLRVIHIEKLPPGWMGKIHALQQGAKEAQGEYLLFTDGDIMMDRTTVSRAVNRMVDENLGHLTLLFKNTSPGWLLNSLILDAGSGLCQVLRPWAARSEGSRFFVGVGAFNMVKKDVYRAVDGHNTMKMQPIDDIMLGKIIKENDYKQECLLGYDSVTVPWYSSVGEMVEGLMKNVLGIINYRFFLVPVLLFTIFCANILPLWGLLFLGGIEQKLFGIVVLVKIISFFKGTQQVGISPWCVWGTFISPYIIFYIVLKATWKNAQDGGIYWRGTFYSLEELRKNRPLFL